MIDLDALLDRCRRGDPLAWEELVRRYEARILGLTLRSLRDPEESRDAAQEIFVRLYSHLAEIRDTATFVPWLMRLARNCCLDRLRARGKRGLPELDPEGLASSLPSPEEAVLADARRTLLYRALDSLSELHREVVVLKDIEQLKLGEIGARLKLPVGTIKSRSSRARTELAKAVRALAGVAP